MKKKRSHALYKLAILHTPVPPLPPQILASSFLDVYKSTKRPPREVA